MFAIGKQFKNNEEQVVNTCIKTRITAVLLFLVISITYYNLPTTQTTDSLYSILLTETIINDKKIDLGEHFDTTSNSEIEIPYQIEKINNKENYYFPHGSSFLSAPFVYIINKSGLRSIQDDSYSIDNEIKIQKILSTGLTAATVAIIFLTFRIFSNHTISLLLTIIFAFATPLVSTLSRGLWAHTWLVLLLSIVVFIVLRNIQKKSLPNPYILATLASWMYFVRPTSSISIIAISIICLFYFKKIVLKYCLSGAMWLLVFIAYSHYNFETLLPSYYLASRLGNEQFLIAIFGNLFSPSRGLFIYSSFIIPVLYLATKQIDINKYNTFIAVSLATLFFHLIVISSFPHWWGGHSYGPRFMSDILPWIVAITALSIYSAKEINKYILSIFILTSALSIFLNTWGAYNPKTAEWNITPTNIDSDTKRLWSWKHSAFLVGITQPAIDKNFITIKNGINHIAFKEKQEDAFIIDGWSLSEKNFRWTDAKNSRIGFNINEISPISISIKFEPFIASKKSIQIVKFYINNKYFAEHKFNSPGIKNIRLEIPERYLKKKNIITIKTPNATSPASYNISEDKRILGIAVYNIDLEKEN